MASIIKEMSLDVPAGEVWDVLRDFGAVASRLAPGFVTGCELIEGARLITFFNGMVVREAFVGRDDERRRIAYSATGGQATHHNASGQVFDAGGGKSRFVWITDVLPDAVAPMIDGMMDAGMKAMKAALEREPAM